MVRARSLVPLLHYAGTAGRAGPASRPAGRGEPARVAGPRHVSHDYLDVMGIGVVAGRGFDESDGPGRPVLRINRTLERSGLLGPDPVGCHVYALGILPWEVGGDRGRPSVRPRPRTGPAGVHGLRQLPYAAALTGPMYFAVRTSEDDATSVVPAIRRIVRELAAGAAVDHVATMDRLLANSTP